MRVSNMTSPQTGKPVANQYEIEGNDGKLYFQSYKTTIAVYSNADELTLDTNALNYSRTTSKYLYQFTQLKRKGIEAGIADGFIKVCDLNTGDR